MVDTQAPAEPATPRLTRRRVVWAAIVLGVAILVAGAVTGVRTWRHYSAAPALYCSCGLVWAPPDNEHTKETTAGSHGAMNVPGDSSRRQAFYVDIVNPSSVSQTVLGLADSNPTGYHFRLQVSTRSQYGTDKTIDQLPYTSDPVRIPPHAERALRFSFRAFCLPPGGSMVWDQLDLKVKVGWFTRKETVDFADESLVVQGSKASARCPSG